MTLKKLKHFSHFSTVCVSAPDYKTDCVDIVNYHLTQQFSITNVSQSPELTARLQRQNTLETLPCRDTHE